MKGLSYPLSKQVWPCPRGNIVGLEGSRGKHFEIHQPGERIFFGEFHRCSCVVRKLSSMFIILLWFSLCFHWKSPYLCPGKNQFWFIVIDSHPCSSIVPGNGSWFVPPGQGSFFDDVHSLSSCFMDVHQLSQIFLQWPNHSLSGPNIFQWPQTFPSDPFSVIPQVCNILSWLPTFFNGLCIFQWPHEIFGPNMVQIPTHFSAAQAFVPWTHTSVLAIPDSLWSDCGQNVGTKKGTHFHGGLPRSQLALAGGFAESRHSYMGWITSTTSPSPPQGLIAFLSHRPPPERFLSAIAPERGFRIQIHNNTMRNTCSIGCHRSSCLESHICVYVVCVTSVHMDLNEKH